LKDKNRIGEILVGKDCDACACFADDFKGRNFVASDESGLGGSGVEVERCVGHAVNLARGLKTAKTISTFFRFPYSQRVAWRSRGRGSNPDLGIQTLLARHPMLPLHHPRVGAGYRSGDGFVAPSVKRHPLWSGNFREAPRGAERESWLRAYPLKVGEEGFEPANPEHSMTGRSRIFAVTQL